MNIASSLKLAATQHPLESRELDELFERVESAILACMSCTSMDTPKNVTQVVRVGEEEKDESYIVRQALSFVTGPLERCIANDITGIMGTAQISTHVNNVFWASLKPSSKVIIRELPDLFQVRSGCTTFRYRPAFMFILEGFCKVVYLVLVAVVSSEVACNEEGFNVLNGKTCQLSVALSKYEFCITIMALMSFLYEIGEAFDRRGIWGHLMDGWNAIDMVSNLLVAGWFFTRQYRYCCYAQGFLAISAIPMSIGLLRFLSISKSLGQLINLIFAMSADLISFLAVFTISLLGFGIAFHSIFPDTEEFSDQGSTFLTLFKAAMGDHDFDDMLKDHSFRSVGVTTMVAYITFVTIILLNLIIARMSSTFQKLNEKSFERWSMVMARNVQDCLLINEKINPFCMLPAPLNIFSIFSILLHPFEFIYIKWISNLTDDGIPSICGYFSDIVLGLLTAPLCAAVEVVVINMELWTSQIPRFNKMIVTLLSVIFFPLWYVLFLITIIYSMFCMKFTIISKRTNRIIYRERLIEMSIRQRLAEMSGDRNESDSNNTPSLQVNTSDLNSNVSENEGGVILTPRSLHSPVEVATGGVLTIKLLRLTLSDKLGIFGRKAQTYVKATYGSKFENSPTKVYEPSATVSHTYKFNLTDVNVITFQVFDRDDMDTSNVNGAYESKYLKWFALLLLQFFFVSFTGIIYYLFLFCICLAY